MKTFSFLLFALFVTLLSKGQTDQTKYPEPEFSNEVYLLKKDSSKVIRLEKGASKMDTKTKMGGMAGMENGYPWMEKSQQLGLLQAIIFPLFFPLVLRRKKNLLRRQIQ